MTQNRTQLFELLRDAPLVVCLGPGGVGKTTISAVLALHQAAAGQDSLVLTIDPARRLADALNLAGLTNDPAEVTSFRKMHPAGSLHALMLDPTATFDHMIAMLVADPERRAALLANRFYQHMSRALAGTLEYMAVERLHELSRSERFSSIVLDTPPTTNALDFIDAPDRIATFFSERVTRWFMPDAEKEKSSWSSRLFHRAGASALALLSRMAGDSFVEETVGFFSLFSDLLGHFRSRGVVIGELLRDPQAVFLIVCGPDANRIEEAQTIDRTLAKSGCRTSAFIVNRVDESFLPQDESMDIALGRAATLLGGAGERERVEVFVQRLEALRQQGQCTTAAHRQVVETLRKYAGSRPVFTAPSVPVGQSARASLLAIYLSLFGKSEDPTIVRPEEEQPLPPPLPPPYERRQQKRLALEKPQS